MDEQQQQELTTRMTEAQTRLEQVRDEISVTGLPMSDLQRDRLDQAKLYVRSVKAQFEAALGNQSEAGVAAAS